MNLAIRLRIIAAVLAPILLVAALLCACAPGEPKPSNEQIEAAIKTANHGHPQSLPLVFEDMEVPQRSAGQAQAVLWVADKSIQRNFTIAYDKNTKRFYVKDFITLHLGEDGVYRKEE